MKKLKPKKKTTKTKKDNSFFSYEKSYKKICNHSDELDELDEQNNCECTTYNWPCISCSKKADDCGYSFEDYYGYPEYEEQ